MSQVTQGQIKKINFNITEPFQATDQSLDITGSLSVMVGQNGTGKTFILILTYILTTICAAVVYRTPYEILKQLAQFTFDHCFDDQNIDGTVGCEFTSGADISVILEKGKVVDVSYNGFENINTATPAVFMSSGMRLFSSIKQYLKLRKMFIQHATNEPTQEEIVQHMLVEGEYKLYDVTYIEKLIHKCPIVIPDNIHRVFKEDYDFKEDIKEFDVDLDKCDFYIIEGNEFASTKYASTYGNGHQAVLNMMVGNC